MSARTVDSPRSRLIRLIHTGCSTLGIDNDERRSIQLDITGKLSLTTMSDTEIKRMLHELRRRGFVPVKRTESKKRRGRVFNDWLPPFTETGKLRAMWLSLWHLDLVSDPSPDALQAWVRNSTGMSAAQWVSRAQMSACIEGVKSWLARSVADGGGGVEWNDALGKLIDPRLAVYSAQLRRLGIPSEHSFAHESAFAALTDPEKDAVIAGNGAQIRSLREMVH